MGRIALLLIMIMPVAMAENGQEWIRISCSGGDVYFSVKAHPHGITMPAQQICRCMRQRWRGAECDMERSKREWYEWVQRKNLEIMQSIQPGSIRVEQPSREK